MTEEKIKRINELAKKSKIKALSEEEKEEQTALRNEYRAEIRGSLTSNLDNTFIQTPDGRLHKIQKNK